MGMRLYNVGIDIFCLIHYHSKLKGFHSFDFWRNKILAEFLFKINVSEAADKHNFSIHVEIEKEKKKERKGISKTPKL